MSRWQQAEMFKHAGTLSRKHTVLPTMLRVHTLIDSLAYEHYEHGCLVM
jgi:hypothetical protein